MVLKPVPVRTQNDHLKGQKVVSLILNEPIEGPVQASCPSFLSISDVVGLPAQICVGIYLYACAKRVLVMTPKRTEGHVFLLDTLRNIWFIASLASAEQWLLFVPLAVFCLPTV